MAAIGRILLMPKGDYSATTVYAALDWVRYSGAAWVCTTDNTTGIAPGTGVSQWQLLVEDGTVGGWNSLSNKPFDDIGQGLEVVTSGSQKYLTVDIGDSFEFDSDTGALKLKTASTIVKGGIKVDGTTITVDGNGVASASGSSYVLPIASTQTLGGIKPDGSTITVDSDGVASASGSGGGHTMTPTPSAALNRATLQAAIALAVQEGGINDDVVSAWAVGNWSNTMTYRVMYSGTIAVGDTGIGTWIDDTELAALKAESDLTVREAMETTGTGGYGWWKDSHFLGLDQYNDYEIRVKYKLQATNEIITLGGYILDSDTGCLCIKFGNEIQNAGNVVAVDIIVTQNNVSSSGGV